MDWAEPAAMVTVSLLASLAEQCGLAKCSVGVRSLEPRPRVDALLAGPELYPASMLKTPLAAILLTDGAAGNRHLADEVEIAGRNMTHNDGPSPLVPGYRASLSELLDLMITRSDNVATNTLYDVLGRDYATERCAAMGLAGTAFRRKLSGSLPLIDDPERTGVNAHPPADALELYSRIGLERIPGATYLEGCLRRQMWNTKLSVGLCDGDVFAHKTGDTDEVNHDGGILTTAQGDRYAIVVYTALPGEDPQADARLGAFMRALRVHL